MYACKKQSFIFYKSEIALWHLGPLFFPSHLSPVFQMLWFYLLKFHDRCKLIVQWKCIWPVLWTPKELKPERHEGGRRAGRTSTSLMPLGCGDPAVCCKALNILWPTNNTHLCLNCSSRPSTKQTCCLKAVTLTFFSMYNSSGNFPIWAARGSLMRS